MVRLRIFAMLMVAFCRVDGYATETEAATRAELAEAVAAESKADEVLVQNFKRWDTEKLRELSRSFNNLSEDVAIQAVWLIAQAPSRFDTTQILASAMSSPSSAVRSHAADVMLAVGTPDANRLVLTAISTDRDPEVIKHMVDALATQKNSVRILVDLICKPGIGDTAIEAAAEHLRRLTRTNLPNTPAEWSDWWLDNEQYYEQ